VRGILPDEERRSPPSATSWWKQSRALKPASSVCAWARTCLQARVQVGAPVTIVTPRGNSHLPDCCHACGASRGRHFEVGMYEFDSGLVLLHLDDAPRFTGCRQGQRSASQDDDIYRAPLRRSSLTNSSATTTGCATGRASTQLFPRAQDGKDRDVRDHAADCRGRGFNIVSTLIMVVTDKRARSRFCVHWVRAQPV